MVARNRLKCRPLLKFARDSWRSRDLRAGLLQFGEVTYFEADALTVGPPIRGPHHVERVPTK